MFTIAHISSQFFCHLIDVVCIQLYRPLHIMSDGDLALMNALCSHYCNMELSQYMKLRLMMLLKMETVIPSFLLMTGGKEKKLTILTRCYWHVMKMV